MCSRYRTPGSERRLQSNLPATFPKEKLSVDFGTRCQTLPTNPAFFFPLFQTRWLRILLEKWGKRSKRRREEREGKKQPQGWRKIVHACALKRKVCGQLLKDFFFLMSQDYPQSQGRERQSAAWWCQCKASLWVTAKDTGRTALFFTSFSPQTFIEARSARPLLHALKFKSRTASWPHSFSIFASERPVEVFLIFTSSFVSVDHLLLLRFEANRDESCCQGHGAAFAQPRLSKGWKDPSPWNTSWPVPPFCMWGNCLRRNRHRGRERERDSSWKDRREGNSERVCVSLIPNPATQSHSE